jgi:4-amino-4-deoxy-L-arabinose transferase-like glycosyltransferase
MGVNQGNYFLFALIALVVIAGMFVPVMEIDAAQYASIAKQMWQEKSFLQIVHRDINYLDKPPLLFWLSSISIGVFGISDFAFKLPSVVSSILGIWSTFRFARHFYGEKTAYHAALMYAGSVAFLIFNNDIRTDTLVINLLIFSVYQLVLYRETNSGLSFVLAFGGIGLGMLAKGPMGLVFPVLAVGGDVLLHRNWSFVLKWQWLLGLLIVILILTPMMLGLYWQFDSNPKAWVNGEQGVSGLKFFFWTQSFGRITGDSVWATAYSNNPGPFFLLTTFLWAFLPWTPVFISAFIKQIVSLFRSGFRAKNGQEWISFFFFLIPLIALSKSGYQLNHYIYVVIPFASIMAANQWSELMASARGKLYVKSLALIVHLMILTLMGFILFWIFPINVFMAALIIGLMAIILGILSYHRVFVSLLLSTCFAFGVMNLYFYPKLLGYQGGRELSEKIESLKTTDAKVYYFRTGLKHSLDFYQERYIPYMGYILPDSLPPGAPIILIVDKQAMVDLNKTGLSYNTLDSISIYPVTQLNMQFLNPKTRADILSWRYLVSIPNELMVK